MRYNVYFVVHTFNIHSHIERALLSFLNRKNWKLKELEGNCELLAQGQYHFYLKSVLANTRFHWDVFDILSCVLSKISNQISLTMNHHMTMYEMRVKK